jgi:predicted NUDIX family NTP pyrophosphohydrolase
VWDEAIADHTAGTTFGGKNQRVVPSETLNDYKADVSGLATSAALAIVDGNVDSILEDTNELQTNQGNWLTATGFSTHSAEDVWSVATRSLTDKAGFTISGTKTTLDALNDISSGDVSTACGTALDTYDPPTATEMASAFTEIKGATWSSATDTLEHIRDKQSDIETDTQDLQTQIGTDGAGLTNIPWNSAWDAEVQSECTDALNAYDPPTATEMNARTLPSASYATAAALSTHDGKLDTVDTVVDGIQADLSNATDGLGALKALLDQIVSDLESAYTDATSLTTNSLRDRIRTLGWIIRNKMEVTNANGNTVIYKDDGTTPAFSVPSAITDDSTTTTRKRME